MNNCIYIRNRKGKPFCKLLNKEIEFSQCRGCEEKEYKPRKQYKPKKVYKIKQRTYKQAKAEANRYSILTDDFTSCIECGRTNVKIDKHEIFGGRNRQISIKMGLVIPFCRICHNSQEKQKKWKAIGQKKYMKHYNKNIEEFISIFGKNYL